MHKDEIKEYQITEDGNLVCLDPTKEKDIEIDSNKLEDENEFKESNENCNILKDKHTDKTLDVIKENNFNLDSLYLSNPFLYNYSPTSEIMSIEDFYLKRKNKYYKFGSLVRNKSLGPIRTKRLIRRYFKEWKEEIERKVNSLNLISETRFSDTLEKKKLKIKFISPLLNILAIFLSLMIINKHIWIFECPNNFLLIPTYFALVLPICLLMLIHLYNAYIHKKQNYYGKSVNEVRKLKDNFTNSFNKKYNETYKYYAKRITRKITKPVLMISNISLTSSSLENLENIINSNSKKILFDNKHESMLKVFREILRLLSFIPLSYDVILMIYEIILYYVK